MSETKKPLRGQQRVEVKIKAEEPELYGSYSNLAQINHSAEEFIVNFIYVVPGSPLGKLMSSVILSPGHAKRFLRALEENIINYENKFGPIKTRQGVPEPEIGFVQ
jgi:hypothetical protein